MRGDAGCGLGQHDHLQYWQLSGMIETMTSPTSTIAPRLFRGADERSKGTRSSASAAVFAVGSVSVPRSSFVSIIRISQGR
ncbi:MAG TPA: hypothetical protein VF774_09595 [Pseudoduganella sp.]